MTTTSKIVGTITAIGLFASLAVSLTACSSTECDRGSQRNLGIVAGATANEPAPVVSQQVTDLLAKSSASNGSVTIVIPSGTPDVQGTTSIGSEANDGSVCSNDQHQAVNDIGGYLATLKAKKGQTDFLDAIDKAAQGAGSQSLGVVVMGSGLQTVDPLSFSAGDLLYANPATVANDLAARSLLPASLAGKTVFWQGIGDVSSPQRDLTIPAKNNLIAIWSAVIAKAGGKLVVIGTPSIGDAASHVPTVSTVAVRVVATADYFAAPIPLHENDLKFAFGKTTFADPTLAAQTLSTLVQPIIANGQLVTITGATSRDGATSNKTDLLLGTARATTVKDELIKLGVPSALLTTASVGHEWCGFQDESDGAGGLSAQIEQSNREVILTSAGVGLCGK